MRKRPTKVSALGLGIFLAAVVFSASADAGSLRQASVSTASEVTGALPGQVLWTSYQTADMATLSFSTALSDDGGGDPNNLTYLQTQCGALVGNGTGGGVCNCPTE